MRRTMVLAVSLAFVGLWSQDGARAQTAPPVSLAPPQASQPQASPPASARNSRPKRDPALVTAPGAAPSAPVIGGFPASPNPAADYDGFSVGTEDNDTPRQAAPPARSRGAKNGSTDPDSFDPEDEALRRKLTICKNCK
ncbi:hypothetical protein SAMN05192541_11662 [Bradyrhizobium arachidis]|uniref:Uncharacterized protein n=2 Tax=Bradyrhizobium arachidis TaxID=858423 RepID=A0AAE7NZS5_9BRAD|nr:hypothetical protein [Bradyrhizobium arachidis]QOZ73411.1 hypothetical protein WN72_17040 [Bradyrhizobium arachidis]SFV10633.1 hypothetical protein SAMN05192541_11662 [Bradyrhizobium arachidis]